MSAAWKIHTVPVLEDNVDFVIEHKGRAWVVDAGEAEPLIAFLEAHRLTCEALWITHHHWDHVQGIEQLKRATGCRVFAPDHPAIPAVDEILHGSSVRSCAGQDVHILETPGHGSADLSFYVPGLSAVFCGDLLMVGGCGRRFDGTVETMWASLQLLAGLPPETRVYCGHEYTVENYRFACSQSEDAIYRERLVWAQGQERTVPSTMAEELRSNIFLRAGSAERFGRLRHAKDQF